MGERISRHTRVVVSLVMRDFLMPLRLREHVIAGRVQAALSGSLPALIPPCVAANGRRVNVLGGAR